MRPRRDFEPTAPGLGILRRHHTLASATFREYPQQPASQAILSPKITTHVAARFRLLPHRMSSQCPVRVQAGGVLSNTTRDRGPRRVVLSGREQPHAGYHQSAGQDHAGHHRRGMAPAQPRERLIVRDQECRGLALIVNPSTMTWTFAYRPRGLDPLTGRRPANRTVTIGNPATHSPEAARTEANTIKGRAAAGADPVAEHRAARARDRQARAGIRRRSRVAGPVWQEVGSKQKSWSESRKRIDECCARC